MSTVDAEIELGRVRISEDTPEAGLVTVEYEPAAFEAYIDVADGEQRFVAPAEAFRTAVREYLRNTETPAPSGPAAPRRKAGAHG